MIYYRFWCAVAVFLAWFTNAVLKVFGLTRIDRNFHYFLLKARDFVLKGLGFLLLFLQNTKCVQGLLFWEDLVALKRAKVALVMT